MAKSFVSSDRLDVVYSAPAVRSQTAAGRDYLWRLILDMYESKGERLIECCWRSSYATSWQANTSNVGIVDAGEASLSGWYKTFIEKRKDKRNYSHQSCRYIGGRRGKK